jgi:hypothetical protein
MGLHTGEPAVGAEGYHGLDVVRAARICSAGRGAQTLVSETTRALIGNDVPPGVDVVDLGRQRLKDVQDERIYQLSLDGAPARLPELKTERASRKSHADILGDDFDRRIERFVRQRIQDSMELRAPTPAPKRPTRMTTPALAILFVLIVGAIGIILIVKLAFF